MKKIFLPLLTFILFLTSLTGQGANVDIFASEKHQQIDGFGAHQGGAAVKTIWWQQLYYDDMGASIYRVDLTPRLVAPYSNLSYYSPWFMGSQTDNVFNLENPDNPDGPEGNRVRTYTGAQDYSRLFGGLNAPIAVMGPDIDANVALFNYPNDGAIQAGLDRQAQLGDFKLIGSLWSPVPWVKVSSGNTYNQNWWPGPVSGTPWPFIWGGNFAGGKLDVSGTLLPEFDDAALGGTGPTSALTQFARSTAAYVRGFQQHFGISFYAISIQNELNFEQFYNSATYPLSSQYITALKAIRAEFDQYDDLKDIRIMGPEDLLGGDAYGLWQYGGAGNPTHKNLQYLQHIAADPTAAAAIDFFCIHGYDSDGVSSAGASSTSWNRWVNGWQASPAPGIPANVAGFGSYGKKSWMTETSGENAAWIYPTNGFPNNGGWSIALKIHQALSVGMESAWLYWTFSEDPGTSQVGEFALTSQTAGNTSPKYVGAKHFFKYIRPGAWRVGASVAGNGDLLAGAYLHEDNKTLTAVLINAGTMALTVTVNLHDAPVLPNTLNVFTSDNSNLWQASTASINQGSFQVTIPAYGVVTVIADGVSTTGTESISDGSEQFFRNHPNPFADQTRLQFRIAKQGRVSLWVEDESGRRVSVLQDDVLTSPGLHEVLFTPGDLPSGIYYGVLRYGVQQFRQKLVLVR
ncbi:MAG: hypothetical protein H6575_10345 [Lewinellaceae bacterium]|nr:hypothetical protein [Lewinellaceae bacterium]